MGDSGQDIFWLHDAVNFIGSIDGAGGSDTVVGGNRANAWTVDGAGLGSVTGLLNGYSNIENLIGNTGDDSFEFTSASASITGLIYGAGHSIGDSVDLRSAGRIVVLGENITSSGTLKADAQSGKGGEIELHAKGTTLLTANSV